jgi:hypothetical protein
MTLPAVTLTETELRRLRSLVEVDAVALDAVHAQDFVLVHPSGGVWTKDQYIGGVVSGRINYRRFDAVSEIEEMVHGNVGVVRYRSAIDLQVGDAKGGEIACWHLDCYRRVVEDAPWQVVWSQATEISV